MREEVFETWPYPQGQQRHLEHGGFSTSYWVYGQDGAVPLLLIHGFRGDHHGLEFLAHALAQVGNFCLLVPDLPGFGATRAPAEREHTLDLYQEWLASFTESLHLEKIHLLGHSFGSIICSHAVAHQRVSPLTLTLINPICEPALSGQNRLAAHLAEFYYRAGATLPERAGRTLLALPLITRLTSEFMAKTQSKNLRRFIHRQHRLYFSAFSSRQALLEAYQASTNHHVAQVAKHIHCPTLSIIGEVDDLGSPSAQRMLARTIPNCQLETIPQVGHLIHYEAPQTAARHITRFIQETA